MAGIYLGNGGLIKLRRTGSRAFSTSVSTEKVNIIADRLVTDFSPGTFTTGDRVTVTRVDGGALDFISGNLETSLTVYLNVDSIGGLKFYTSWTGALNNDATSLALAAPGATYTATIEALNDGLRTVGQVTSYTLSTSRATADVTSLGDSFTESISTLISGSGTMECLWSYASDGTELETAMYFHQLAVRQQVGSSFTAAFILKQGEDQAAGNYIGVDTETLYYLVTGMVTNVAVSFTPGEQVQSTIDFVTTGLIAIRYGNVEAYLLQENTDRLLLEQTNDSLLLEDP